jgi:integral membrane protein
MAAMKAFRIIGYLEGTSFLLLLFVAMPLKYAYGMPTAVKYVGWVHGVLFMLYLASLTYVQAEKNWPARRTLLAAIAAVLPFGPFVFHRSL